ncbi:MAG: class I SAM-dependent methyltransferase, partial [Solirubrobacteraceae bacterium]
MQALEYPTTASLSVDSPETTIQRWQIIRDKAPLRQIYDEWYLTIASSLPGGDEPVLELGSGAGFMSTYVPNLITTDILELPGLGRVMDACAPWPFPDDSLRAVAMVNTLHHLHDVTAFFREAIRCLTPGGVISMIEPWNSWWSRFVYGRLHPEPFDPRADSWSFRSDGPLSDANVA